MTLLQRDREKYEEGKIEGRIEGKIEELIALVDDGLLTVEVAAKRANVTIEKFSELQKTYCANIARLCLTKSAIDDILLLVIL